MLKLVLFDIDGTLALTGGAGLRALERAFEDVFKAAGAFNGIEMPGRTDRVIVKDALESVGLRPDEAELVRFREKYCDYLRDEILVKNPSKRMMPGVSKLLDVLALRDDTYLGLLTGNFSTTARVKLEYFRLWHYFLFGAYGEDAEDRDRLVPVALERAVENGVPSLKLNDVFVVGDTPRDVGCALAAGARSVAVATGNFDMVSLRASGAEFVLKDLSDTEAFISLLNS